MTIPVSLAFGRFKQLPQRTGEVWQGGLVRLPMWIAHPTDPEGEPYRPVGALWVSLRTELVHVALPQEGSPASPDLALSALFEFGLKWSRALEGRPARVEVQDAALRDALAEPLGHLSTSVSVVDEMPAVRDVLHALETRESGGRRLPGVLESSGVRLERLRAFADAARAFYTARVWDHLANEDLIVVDGDSIPAALRHVCVLGQGGQQFGLSFFDSRAAFERLINLADEGRRPTRAHGVTFGSIDELPLGDADAWLDHGLPVAGPQAYPLQADLHVGGSIRRPDGRELSAAEAILRALADSTEDELDAGRWTKRVQTFDGPLDLTLSLPLLLEGEAGQAPARIRPAAMPRVAERSSARIQRLMEGRSFESLEDLNAEIERASQQGLFDLPAEAAAGRELTPLERAQELAYDAMEAEGRLRIKRARQALAVSPDCADAWVILAEAAPTPELALERYEQGMTAGARALGTERFSELIGDFWGNLEGRPYLRARLGLAQTLRSLGRDDDALSHYRELLRLNPNDNQGVRYLLLPLLVERGQDHEAGALLDEYEGDIQAIWPYGRAFWRYRTQGDTPEARAALADAIRANPHVVRYLLHPQEIPFEQPPTFTIGSAEEATQVAEAFSTVLDATPGLTDWLMAQARKRTARSPRSARRHRRGGRRS